MQYYDQRCLQEKIIRKEIVNYNNIYTNIYSSKDFFSYGTN